jgi:hypothetical protein
LTTESRRNPVTRFDKRVLPGARANARLLVSTQTTTVLIALPVTGTDGAVHGGALLAQAGDVGVGALGVAEEVVFRLRWSFRGEAVI